MDSADVEKTSQLKATVFRAIESLLDSGLPKDVVEKACAVLDVTSFSDVAEERSLSKFCGYPVCSSRLQDKAWSKYLIRRHKVYDTAERRQFCSDRCYECFLHLRDQLPEEPLWFRGAINESFKLSFMDDLADQKLAGLPGRELSLVEDDLTECLSRMKLEDESPIECGTSIVSTAEISQRERQGNDAADSTDPDGASPSQTDQSKEATKKDDDDDDDDDPLMKHIDCELSALGNWQPSRAKGEPKPLSANRPRRPILIDPLPLKPVVKKRNV